MAILVLIVLFLVEKAASGIEPEIVGISIVKTSNLMDMANIPST